MNLFYSGEGRRVNPEVVITGSAIMLTYWDLLKYKPDTSQPEAPTTPTKRFHMQTLGKNKGLFFLDSGAHSLYMREVHKSTKQDKYAFFETKPFWNYVDSYAAFVKEHENVIDYYANVDVIRNPDLTWKVQKYMERKHKLKPIPVIHYLTPMKWVEHYLEHGYTFIGLGGLGQGTTESSYLAWADRIFNRLCPSPSYKPIVKIHGFAMTSYTLLRRYPWWSVDSASWTKSGAFGNVMCPHKRKGKFTFDTDPYVIATSEDSPTVKQAGRHYLTISVKEQNIFKEWLDEIGVPLGSTDKNGEKVLGVLNHHTQRKIANLHFFERFRASLPDWPWAFKIKQPVGFDIW